MKSGSNNCQRSVMKSGTIGGAVRSRALWLGSATALLWFYPDATLSVVGAILHMLVGWIEIGLKSLLEGAFGLSHRAAQVIVAWSGMGMLLVALVVAIRRLWRFATELFAALQSVAMVSLAALQLAHLRLLIPHAIVAATGFALAVYGLV